MGKDTRDKDALIDAISKLDPVYQEKLKEFAELEKRFDKMAAQLSREQRDLAWDFGIYPKIGSLFLMNMSNV